MDSGCTMMDRVGGVWFGMFVVWSASEARREHSHWWLCYLRSGASFSMFEVWSLTGSSWRVHS